jgi:permease
MATLFGKSEINLEEGKLIGTLLIIQIEAIIGAVIFSRLSKKIGNKNVISITVFLWIVVCVWAYVLNKANPNVEYHFYAVAGLVGLVMGGLQAMSRSTYSRLLPEDSMDNTTFFSFYDVLEKIAIMVGTLIFSFIIDKYDVIKECFAQVDIALPSAAGMRFAAFFMGIFFLLGLILIRFVKINVMGDKEVL